MASGRSGRDLAPPPQGMDKARPSLRLTFNTPLVNHSPHERSDLRAMLRRLCLRIVFKHVRKRNLPDLTDLIEDAALMRLESFSYSRVFCYVSPGSSPSSSRLIATPHRHSVFGPAKTRSCRHIQSIFISRSSSPSSARRSRSF